MQPGDKAFWGSIPTRFMQVLEGKATDVEDIYDSIMGDSRHKGAILVLKQTIDLPTFSDWSMGFKNYSEHSKTFDGEYTAVLDRKRNPDIFASNSDMVLDLLDQFKQGNS